MKILIIKNKDVKQSSIDKHTKLIEDYYEVDAPKTFNFKPIKIEFTQIDTSVPIKMIKVGATTTGKSAYGADDVKRHIRSIVPQNKYNVVYFFYKNKSMFSSKSYIAAFTYRIPLYSGTEMVQIPRTVKTTAGRHELMHVIGKLINIKDVMDRTFVNGQWYTYYKNKLPLELDSNYAYTWALFKPYLYRLVNGIKPIIKPYVPKQVPISNKYKYFSKYEVAGLKTELVLLLDKARGLAGIPFVINSGFRTKAKNKAVGGVANSSHLTGEAVDIRARNGAETYAIIKAAIEVGIKRIGINRKKKFVHLDISKTKPSPTIYEY